jgi:hypothetical protein
MDHSVDPLHGRLNLGRTSHIAWNKPPIADNRPNVSQAQLVLGLQRLNQLAANDPRRAGDEDSHKYSLVHTLETLNEEEATKDAKDTKTTNAKEILDCHPVGLAET